MMLNPEIIAYSVVNSPPASTRASVVLPAFCKPIMVMSISVDLCLRISIYDRNMVDSHTIASRVTNSIAV